MKYFKILLLFIAMVSFSCKDDFDTISTKNIYKLPKHLNEVSGLTFANNSIWTLQDSGNKNEIYKLSNEGKLLKTITIIGVKNKDWEAICSDEDGNIYIGNFGNNNNDRKDLEIYKISKDDLENDSASPSKIISFHYEDQKKFPPKRKHHYFDCESFFVSDGNFYLITKNRSSNFNGTFSIYKLNTTEENQIALKIGEGNFCNKFNSCSITDASISPDGSKIALLSNKRVWIYNTSDTDNFVKTEAKEFKFDSYTQREGISFKDNSSFYITDEKTKKVGGNLYYYELK